MKNAACLFAVVFGVALFVGCGGGLKQDEETKATIINRLQGQLQSDIKGFEWVDGDKPGLVEFEFMADGGLQVSGDYTGSYNGKTLSVSRKLE